MRRIIIAGSRDFSDYKLLCESLDELIAGFGENAIEFVSGTCRGADRLGERYAKEKGFPVKRFPANWGTYGKRAGVLRNAQMADYADTLIAFWDGMSRGTKNMISEAGRKHLKVFVVRY